MAQQSFSKIDEFGFERPENFDYTAYGEFLSKYIDILSHQHKKWLPYFDERRPIEKTGKLKRLIRKGIPHSKRGYVWMAVSGANYVKERSPELYKRMLKSKYDPEVLEIINKDIPRTFPDNINFRDPNSFYKLELFNVLIAYAHDNVDVGYCQGMSYITGLLLLVTNNAESSFYLLKVLLEDILPDYYVRTMDGLLTDIEVLGELMKKKIPDVHNHVIRLGLSWAIIATKWFVCLFADVLPPETVLRIWDCLFNEGSKILFRVSLTLVKLNRRQILECSDVGSLSECFKEIVTNHYTIDCHGFMKSIFKVTGSLSNVTIETLRITLEEQRTGRKPKR